MLTTLLLLNIPVYLFIGWLVFDTKEDAAETFLGTIVVILKAILIPGIIRVMMGDDDEGAGWGIVPIAIWFIACALIVYGEYRLIENYWLAGAS